jgi:hypothetical protein
VLGLVRGKALLRPQALRRERMIQEETKNGFEDCCPCEGIYGCVG